jgi:hypothetical protein
MSRMFSGVTARMRESCVTIEAPSKTGAHWKELQ